MAGKLAAMPSVCLISFLQCRLQVATGGLCQATSHCLLQSSSLTAGRSTRTLKTVDDPECCNAGGGRLQETSARLHPLASARAHH